MTQKRRALRISGLLLPAALWTALLMAAPLVRAADTKAAPETNSGWAEIRVTDAATGRGIPLVELESVNSIRYVTDNMGRVAFNEPGLLGRELFFTVRSHGYEMKKDGFGFAGLRITPRVGQVAEIKLTRRNLAERLCRLTGEGLYRDTLLLGHKPPQPPSPHPGRVAGQDSIQAAVYGGKVYCFWGDTLRMEYPLGIFRMAGATMRVPDPNDATTDPIHGISYDYFVDPKSGFARNMMPLPERPEGVVWIFGVCTVPDAKGVQRLVGHYSRRKGLVDEYEQGVAVFDDEKAIFQSAKQVPLTETWRHPSGNPIPYEADGTKWILFGSPSPNIRVRATLEDILDPSKYEAFTCLKAEKDGKPSKPELDSAGRPVWRWQKDLPPTTSKMESEWVKAGLLQPEHARFFPADAADPKAHILLHSGSVRWNAHRKRWIMLVGQLGGKSSLLGEVWYAEATAPTGPFTKAVKVVTHDRQTFYNVCHHDFMDRDGGRLIHFEGTYTNDFSGNPDKTPRYNYNQVLYRLDLDTAALRPAHAE